MINISESVLKPLIPHSLDAIIQNGQKHLRRVYPRGTRIESGNLNPLLYWRAGSHFPALNWQDFDEGVQLNEAMFSGTGGWVLKPAGLRDAGGQKDGKVRVQVEIGGLSARALAFCCSSPSCLIGLP